MSTTTKPAVDLTKVRVVQPARTQDQIVRHVQPTATSDEVSASTCSCVVHLCGCK